MSAGSSPGSRAHLNASGNIVIGNDLAGDQVSASESVLLVAGGDIIDNNGDGIAAVSSVSGQVTLVAGGDIGEIDFSAGSRSAFEIDSLILSAQADGALNLLDLDSNIDGVQTIIDSFTDKAGTTIDVFGLSSGQDLALESGGLLVLSDSISSANGSVAIKTNGSISVGSDITATDHVSLESGEEIIDLRSGSGALIAPNVVLQAATGIGDEPGTVDLEVQATNLAARTTTSGDINIVSSSANLNITELDALLSGETITGLQSAGDICLTVDNTLTVERMISATDQVLLSAQGDIVNSISVSESITSSDTVILDAGNTISDDTDGQGGIVAETVILDSVNGVRAEVQTSNLAARSTSSGDIDITGSSQTG